MSSHRYYHKGSSTSRDDSRSRREREHRHRSRSRSPRRYSAEPRESHRRTRDKKSREHEAQSDYKDKRSSERDHGSSSPVQIVEDPPLPPPPPRITKISIGFSKPKAPIKMSLSGPSTTSTTKAKPTVAAIFSADDDEEPEEMPAEARMRMRNIGRETPTSAGPNSFGKTKQGFCDAKKVFEKNLKQALETAETPKSSTKNLPQTIYKITTPQL